MADRFLRADLPAVQKVFTITLSGPVAADTITIALKDAASGNVVRSHTYTVLTSPSVDIVSAALYAMLAASPYEEFKEMTFADVSGGTGKVTLTQLEQYKGQTLFVEVSKTGTVTVSIATTTESSSPSDIALAANWTGGSVPITTDNAIFDALPVDVLYNLAAYSQVAALRLTNTKRIGLQLNNGRYREWRPRYLKMIFTSCFVSCPDSNLIRLDGAAPGSVGELVIDSVGANGFEDGYPAMCFKCAGSGYNITINRGSLGIAVFAGETAVIPTLRQAFTDNASDTNVVCGPGVTLTDVYRSGGKFDFCTALAILEQREQAGDAVFRGGGVTLGTVTLYSGSLILRPIADNTELTNIVLGPGTTLDLSKCMYSVRCPNPIIMYKDSELIDPFDRLATATPTDGSPDPLIDITPAGCSTKDLKYTRKSGKTGTRI